MFRKAIFWIFGIGCAILIVAGILRMTPLWQIILPAGPSTKTDFATLVPPDSPNWFLVCPVDHCLNSKPSMMSPDFPFGAEKLKLYFKDIFQENHNIRILSETETTFELVVRTKWIGWPDHVSIQILPVSTSGSTVAIYSRSNYGKSDFDANQSRIDGWLHQLESFK
jgi:Protein of unknown function (DUF1499)